MKQFLVCIFTCTIAIALITPSTVEAKGRNNSKDEAKATATPDRRTVIRSVSADSITISSGGAEKTFRITKNTTILVLGRRASASDLQVGMSVAVSGNGFATTEAGMISAKEAPKKEAPTPKSK